MTATASTILNRIQEKYDQDDDEDYGFIVFVASSPEAKKGMYPPIMTLCDYDIDAVGTLGLGRTELSKLAHITELDLTDNRLSQWAEIFLLLDSFPSLEFLNLSNNLLHHPLTREELDQSPIANKNLNTRKFVLNGNRITWRTANLLTSRMLDLEQLYLSTNNLNNPSPHDDDVFHHDSLKQLFLSCNPLDNFEAICNHVGNNCPSLQALSLAECPIHSIPEEAKLNQLIRLNLTRTKINDWRHVEHLRDLKNLTELRFQHCPILSEYTAHEKRMMLIARLPNIRILNGGGPITPTEREDAERAFIRYYLDDEEKPRRYEELVALHGKLDPLVNIDFSPETHVKVKFSHKDEIREEVVEVYQTVQQLKAQIHDWFGIPPQNIRLFYCDKDLVEIAGPEEMKWPQKALYTYNVRNGDKFIVDEKVNLTRIRTRNSSSGSNLGVSPGSRSTNSPGRISFILSPKSMYSSNNNNNESKSPNDKESGKSKVARNLFSED